MLSFIPEIYMGQQSYTPFYYKSAINLIRNSKTITNITIAKRPANYRDNGRFSFHLVKAEGPDLSTIRSNEPIPEVHLTVSRSKLGHVDTWETAGQPITMMPPAPTPEVPKPSDAAPIDGPIPLRIDRNTFPQTAVSNSNPPQTVTYQPSQAEIQARAQQGQALVRLHQEEAAEAKAQTAQPQKATQGRTQGP